MKAATRVASAPCRASIGENRRDLVAAGVGPKIGTGGERPHGHILLEQHDVLFDLPAWAKSALSSPTWAPSSDRKNTLVWLKKSMARQSQDSR